MESSVPAAPRRKLDASIGDIDRIVEETRRQNSPLGIFPAMYRSVTASIDRAVHAGFFDDSQEIEQLAVVFADRYIDAYRSWRDDGPVPESWRVAFDAATDGRSRMITQHLLAGMNAHINLDLGVAAADVADRGLDGIRSDFLRVNRILFEKLDSLQDSLGSVSGRMAWIDRLGGPVDERLMKMAIADARDNAWDLALALEDTPESWGELVADRDEWTAALSGRILGESFPMRVASRVISSAERSDMRSVIDALIDE